ncbi:hypothetical protein CANARDRAFT_29486 [[Candida] arabinofermentans NRRL YB-2248]|uniref:Protein CMS1 n=1 Tax=[Candida] arabinofermentans NRRL YB-2248 TaxID=983967 RepID=A0A1E4SX29_9ASCO|nr:hypothetical protein CANARDRAFT_29486 [[Candida] arabinofermentans NRRL YB-2248]
MSDTAADDLNDGLDYTYDNSDDEGIEIKEGEVEVPTKSQADDEDDASTEETKQLTTEVKTGKKRKQKDDKLSSKKKQKMDFDIEQKKQLALQNPDTIAEKIATKIRSQYPDLSALELGELYLNKSIFKNTSHWVAERNLANLSNFLDLTFKKILPEKPTNNNKRMAKKLKKKGPQEEKAKKFVLVLSMSAIRACDVHRATKGLNGSSIKLINKNKLQDDLKVIQFTRSRLLASTPGRIEKILNTEETTLQCSQIGAIVIDSSYLDSKMQNVWELKETVKVIKRITDEHPKTKVYLY